MVDFTFNCSNCGITIEADSTLAGRIIQCPKCNHAVKVSQGLINGGMIIGGYALEKLLGKGGMGEVWLATQISTERKVGLKILDHALSKDPEFIARFNQEMKLVARLDHPGIVSAYEAGYDKGFYFLATSYVNGATLESNLDSGKRFGENEALSIIKQVAEALKYAWDKHRMLHRDIKPANIMVDDNGDVKLMDMGISKSLVEDKSITMTGSILGTPCYMSPEQAKAEKDIDHRSDIYSLGATLYHMLTGLFPYAATTPMGVLARMISENATPVRKINPDVSVKCETMIAKMMAKDKTERHGTWQEVIDNIEKITEAKVLDREFSRSIKDILKKSRIIPTFLALLIITSAAVLLIYLIVKQGRKETVVPETSVEDISQKREYIGNNQDNLKPNENKKPDEFNVVKTNIGKETVIRQYSKPNSKNNKELNQINSDSFDDKRTDGAPILDTAQASTGRKDETQAMPGLKKSLSESIGISEDQAMRLIPIIKVYGKELKQLRDYAPPRGYKPNELRDKIHAITMDAKQKADTVLTKDQSTKFILFLEQERRQALHNNPWRNPGTGAGNK
jgi:serine/threonine-protein kinase